MVSAKSWSEARAAYEGTAFLLDKEYALTLLRMYSDRATLYVPSAASSVQELYDLQAQLIRWVMPLLPTTMAFLRDPSSRQVKRLRLAQWGPCTAVVCFELKTGLYWLIHEGQRNEVFMESASVEAARRTLRKPGHCSPGTPPRHSVLEAPPLKVASAAGP